MIYRLSRLLFEATIHLLFRVRFFGRENLPDKPYILVPNHASYLDPPLVGIAAKKDFVDFMAKEELLSMPVLGAWTKKVGCIHVDRGGSSAGALKEAVKRLSRDRVVCIFPEGTRSETGDLQEAKRGVGFLIAKAAVPIVPVYICGSGDALPRGGEIHPGKRVDVIIGKPVMPDELSLLAKDKKYEVITGRAMSSIAELKEKWTKNT